MARILSVAAIVAVYNEADIIGQVVTDLIGQGVSVYVIDNHSTDDTLARVQQFVGRGVIGIETYPANRPIDDRFKWTALLQRKEELACTLDVDWFIHHDADEFRESPWVGLDLRSAIEIVDRLGFNAIDFELLDFQLTSASIPTDSDVRSALPYYAPAAPFNRVQIRCWKRTGQRVDLSSSGGHDAQFDDRRVFPLRFILRHYPFRSAEQARRKVLVERIPRFDPVERGKGWHVQYDGAVLASKEFVRGTTGLIRYDGDQVRHDLWLRNRLIEERRDDNAALRQQCEQAARALNVSHRELEELVGEAERTRALLAARHDEVTRLESDLDERARELGRAESLTALQNVELRRLENEVAMQRVELQGVEAAAATVRASLAIEARRVAALEASLSWRLTAPGRRLIGWLTRTP